MCRNEEPGAAGLWTGRWGGAEWRMGERRVKENQGGAVGVEELAWHIHDEERLAIRWKRMPDQDTIPAGLGTIIRT